MKCRALYFQALIAAVMVVALFSCASPGRPQGGPRDETPPVFLRSNPTPEATNVKDRRLDIYFDENVQVKDVLTKVVVSPAQIEVPQIYAGGRRVTVELRDTLIPNTTYTIDFADAISDLNEGNVLDGFAVDFSTGATIDTLKISGVLLQAENLEPAQGVLVGVHTNMSDTAISTIPLTRIARTNQLGQFTIRGLKEGPYRIFAINDINRDYMWDRSEDVAFYDAEVYPIVNDIIVTDTLMSSNETDSIVMRPGVEYLPNDILLTWFNEGYAAQYMQNSSRPDSVKIEITMAAPADSLPELTIVEGVAKGIKIDHRNSRLEASAKLDTLRFWITDPEIYKLDSLRIATRYLKTDTADNITWTTDTIFFNYQRSKAQSNNNKKKKKEEETDSLPKIDFVEFTLNGGASQDLHLPLSFTASQPIDTILPEGIHFEIQEDTLWYEMESPKIYLPDSLHPLNFKAEYKWEPGMTYRLTIDSASVFSVYGQWNRPVERSFTVRPIEDYSTITFSISGVDSVGSIVVQLLNSSDEPIANEPVINGKAKFKYLNPGKYFARAFIDSNNNGKWDTGNIAQLLQPEEVYYYPKALELKKNWDVDQSWNLTENPIDAQKPYEIKKNKPKKKNNEEENTSENTDEDDWNTNFYDPNNIYNGTNRNNRNNNQYNNGLNQNRRYQ